MKDITIPYSYDGLLLKQIGEDHADALQDIYKNSPTYFRRVDGTDPLPGMALKDINDRVQSHGEHYVKVAGLIYEGSNAIGYVDIHINHRSNGMAYLGLLILREDLHGKGLGRRAYHLVEIFLTNSFQIEKIYLGVSNHNQVQGYWEKMGFLPNGFTYKWKGEKIVTLVTELEKKIKEPVLKLERPSKPLHSSFLKFVEDMRANNQPLWAPYLPQNEESPEQFVERLRIRELTPESSMVPESIYWAVYDGHVVGRISLRHCLEGNLHKVGGHIGYEVSPMWRKRGFATEMLRLVLLTNKAKEIGQVLLTCSPNNEASNKTILRNGGRFQKTLYVDFIKEDRNHYWIEVKR